MLKTIKFLKCFCRNKPNFNQKSNSIKSGLFCFACNISKEFLFKQKIKWRVWIFVIVKMQSDNAIV